MEKLIIECPDKEILDDFLADLEAWGGVVFDYNEETQTLKVSKK